MNNLSFRKSIRGKLYALASCSIIRIMKISVLLLFSFVTVVQASGLAQNVTLSFNNARMSTVFKEISSQTKMKFLYPNDVVKSAKPVKVTLANVPIEKALDEIFSNQDLSYSIIANTITVKSVERKSSSVSSASVIQQKITGVVKNTAGENLGGATITVKGSSQSATTGDNGRFEITAGPEDVLVVSYVGHNRSEVKVGDRSFITITLAQAASEIETVEVVATGYQTLDRKFFTGSISKVTAEDSERSGVPDITRMLEGQAAGVSIQNVSGTFGAAPKVRVRHRRFCRNDSSPINTWSSMV